MALNVVFEMASQRIDWLVAWLNNVLILTWLQMFFVFHYCLWLGIVLFCARIIMKFRFLISRSESFPILCVEIWNLFIFSLFHIFFLDWLVDVHLYCLYYLSVLQDLHTIYCNLYHMDVLAHLREHQLRWVVDISLKPKFCFSLIVFLYIFPEFLFTSIKWGVNHSICLPK